MTLAAFLSAPLDFTKSERPSHGASSRPDRVDVRRHVARDEDADGDARDLALVHEIRHVDESRARIAFDTLYEHFFVPLWRFACQMVVTDALAVDVVQDMFVRLWIGRMTWTVEGPVRTYLYRAIRNRALNAMRDGRATISLEAHAPRETTTRDRFALPPQRSAELAPDAAIETRDLERALAAAIDALPERQRMALLLFWHEEMNMSEVARVLSITPAASRKLLLAAQATLRRRVAAYLE